MITSSLRRAGSRAAAALLTLVLALGGVSLSTPAFADEAPVEEVLLTGEAPEVLTEETPADGESAGNDDEQSGDAADESGEAEGGDAEGASADGDSDSGESSDDSGETVDGSEEAEEEAGELPAPLMSMLSAAAPQVVVSQVSGLNPAGQQVTISGSGFFPDAAVKGSRPPLSGQFPGFYVTFSSFEQVWRPSEGAASSARPTSGKPQVWLLAQAQYDLLNPDGTNASYALLNADGTFEVQLTVSQFADPVGASYGIYTYPGSGAVHAPFETFTPVVFQTASTALSLTASPASGLVAGATSTLTATVAPVTAGSVTVRQGATVIGTGAVDASGVFSVTTAALPAGSHAFTAEFAPAKPLEFAASSATLALEVAAPVVQEAGVFNWGVKASLRGYVLGGGSISTGQGAGGSGGVFSFPQETSGGFDRSTGTGTSAYRGQVTFAYPAHGFSISLANPRARIDSAASGTLLLDVTFNGSTSYGVPFASLALGSGSRSQTPAAVTYTGVPATLTAAGATAFSGFYAAGEALDPVSFVIGARAQSQAGVSLASTGEPEWTAPETPPATEGIEGELGEDGTFTGTAGGFQPNEPGIRVVIYSTPVVLASDLVADANGVVTWTGTLPATLTGKHTLTFQGSVSRGIVLEIAPPAPMVRTMSAFVGCAVDDATLSWGFKEAFRSYLSSSIANGEWTVADGATYETPVFGFSGGTGGYDAATATGGVAFPGSVNFYGHGGVLDTTISNLTIRFVDADSAVLVLDLSGDTQAGETVVEEAVEFAELDLSAATVSFENGVLTVTDAPATLTEAGSDSFGTYEAGTELDPVSVQLTVSNDCAEAAPAPGDAVESAADLSWLAWAIPVALLVIAGIVVGIVLARRRR